MSFLTPKQPKLEPKDLGPTPEELAAKADKEGRDRKKRKGLLGTILTSGQGVQDADTLG